MAGYSMALVAARALPAIVASSVFSRATVVP
jgi:hypothetical protein